eukprot:Gb_26207 [translate_table: standard]
MADGKKANGKAGGKDGDNKDAVVAKTAGFVIFTGIALSLFKALQPKKPVEEFIQADEVVSSTSIGESVEELQEDVKEKAFEVRKEATGFGSAFGKKFQKGGAKKSSSQSVEIFKGDTLWGLSQKYGVSIDSIKAANGFSDDTIYAGEKITIPC